MEVRPGDEGAAGDRAGAGSAAAAVRDYLLEQVSALHWAVADGDVHDARVACRRTRSVLLAHVDLFSPGQRDHVVQVAGRARALGRDLSAARDAEVVEDVVRGWAAEQTWPQQRLDGALRLLGTAGASDGAVDRARTGLVSLADEVASVAASPVWGPGGSSAAVAGLGITRATEHERLHRRVARARRHGSDPAVDERWHDVRKAAKRLRYTAEVAHQSGDSSAGLGGGVGAPAPDGARRPAGPAPGASAPARADAARPGRRRPGGPRRPGAAGRCGVRGREVRPRGGPAGGGPGAGGRIGRSHHHRPGGPVVTLPVDTDPAFAAYAHPERLVSTQWLADHLGDEGLVVVESDEDVLLYETGHIEGAVKIDWHLDLNDPVTRDYVDGEGFARLVGEQGHRPRHHRRHLRRQEQLVGRLRAVGVLPVRPRGRPAARRRARQVGGRGPRVHHRRPVPAPVEYPVVERDDASIRAFLDDVKAHLGKPMVDVRSPEEYTGARTHMPAYPEEGALRGGHIPGAQSVPWARAAADDGTFKRREELEAIYQGEKGLSPGDDVVAYCRIGERSSHTWFVLTHLLGFEKVRNYDGSWTEWGNVVRVPIVKGEQPGEVPSR